jgi:hypothetical protein
MSSMSVNSGWSPFHFKNVPEPLHNVNPDYVNVTNSNDPRSFGSIETSRQWGLSGVSNNAAAAAASALKGGSRYRSKSLRKKIKNIANKYKKMKGGKSRKMTLGNIKRRLTSILKIGKGKKSKKTVTRRRRVTHKRRQHGGYTQYMSDVRYTPSYSTGGLLSPSNSALANPVPYQQMNNCVDNYNHNTNKGFQL